MPFPHADSWPQNSSWECPSSDMLWEKRDRSCAGFEEEVLGVFHCLSKVLRELKQTKANTNCTGMRAGARSTAVQLERWRLSLECHGRKAWEKVARWVTWKKSWRKYTQKGTDLGLYSFLFSYITKYYKIKNSQYFTLFQSKNVEPW